MVDPLPQERLDSWKGIAAYLRCDERTAQRWARERGLPVHRVPGSGRGRIFAYRAEIDAWLNQQPGDETQAPATTAVGHSPAGSGRFRGIVLSFSAILFVALVVVVATQLPSGSLPGSPDKIRISRTKIEALDDKGRRLWEYSLPEPRRTVPEGYSEGMESLARIVDLDGDGSPEVLATVTLQAPGKVSRGVLHCFTANGKLLWKYDPDLTVTFAGRSFEGPWNINDVLLAPAGKERAVWLAIAHHTWWPSFVVKVDASGNEEIQFVNSGTLHVLRLVQTSMASSVLAGGFNNEWDGGILAVLPAEKPAGTSPQKAGSLYRCDACPPGEPKQYFVFPRSELNRRESIDTNPLDQVAITGGRVQVSTTEATPKDRAFYELSIGTEMQPIVASFSDTYWRSHERLEREGKLNHPARECPERLRPPQVKLWTPEAGWAEASFHTAGSTTAKQVGNR